MLEFLSPARRIPNALSRRTPGTALLIGLSLLVSHERTSAAEPLRAGIIGCDTSHVPRFTEALNSAPVDSPLHGIRVVAAFPGGSPDIPASRDRVSQFTQELREQGVEIVESIDALLERVDVVLLESVDGRTHLSQARPVFAARKPVFIDKPLAGSLADAVAIVQLAEQTKTPMFSSSALRYTPAIHAARTDAELGTIVGCDAYSPCSLEPTHPDLFWYGVHGVEVLFTLMGPDCRQVSRVQTDDGELVTGVWESGRIGTFRGLRAGRQDYGALVFGTQAIRSIQGFGGYEPLLEQIVRFFKTGKASLSAQETLAMFAFMEAADESKRQGGRPVTLESVLAKARIQNAPAVISK
jgi:predicted dehydrogenase